MKTIMSKTNTGQFRYTDKTDSTIFSVAWNSSPIPNPRISSEFIIVSLKSSFLGEQNSHFHAKKPAVFRVNSMTGTWPGKKKTGRLLCELLDLFRQGIQLSVENPTDLLNNPGLKSNTKSNTNAGQKSEKELLLQSIIAIYKGLDSTLLHHL